MIGILLALSASISFGTSDFFGGLAARGRGTITGTTAVYASASLVALCSLLLLPWHANTEAVVAGVLAGVFAIVGFVLFYAALAIGPMSVLSPTIALVNTVVPVAAAVILGDSLTALGWVGVVAALAAGVLVSLEPKSGARVDPRGLLLGLGAGVLLGASIVAVDAAPSDAGVLPAVLETTVGLVVIVPLLLVARRRSAPSWLTALDRPTSGPSQFRAEGSAQRAARGGSAGARFAVQALVAGGLLGISNVLVVLALAGGELAVVSVLVNLYPVVTVVLAAAVLRERLALPQVGGVVLALVAAALLALA